MTGHRRTQSARYIASVRWSLDKILILAVLEQWLLHLRETDSSF